MRLFDSHCHLDDKAFARDVAEVVQRARASGVERIMCAGVTLKTSRKAVQLARDYDGVCAAVGIHPHDVRHCSRKILDALVELAREPEVCAWGEIGLDYNRMYSPRADQERWFVRQLEIADRLGLPIIFHERDSGGRFLELLKAHPNRSRRGVIHCFSGTAAELEEYLALGFYIGITGIITMTPRGRELRRLVPQIPQNRILVETDAPYLIPQGEKGHRHRNEPAFVRAVMLKVARVRKADLPALAARIWQNTCQLYGLAAG